MSKEIYFEQDYKNPERIVIDKGQCFGFNYYIISYGSHPCSYVEIPKYHILYNKDYRRYEDKEEINVHGGITYSQNYLISIDNSKLNWYIGWDYGHAFDYQLFGKVNGKLMEHQGHKWTLEELQKDIFEVCKQLWEMV